MNILSLQGKLTSTNLNSTLYNFFFFFSFNFFFFLSFCSKRSRKNKKKNPPESPPPGTVSLFSCSCAGEIHSARYFQQEFLGQSRKHFRAGMIWLSSQRPVFARFMPLELKGETLPLGPGLSSLKFEFSIANSRNCCLLI
jgi:hypothetical protein